MKRAPSRIRALLIMVGSLPIVAFAATTSAQQADGSGNGQPRPHNDLYREIYGDELERARAMFEGIDGRSPQSPYQYDRGAFEAEALTLHRTLLEAAPDLYGGMALSPLHEAAVIGYTEAGELEPLLPQAPPFDITLIEVDTSYVARESAADHLTRAGFPELTYGSLENSVRLSLSPDALEEIPSDLSVALRGLAPGPQVDDALADLDAAELNGGAMVGPVYVVIEDTGESILDSLSAGVTLTMNGSPVCTSGFAMRRISTGELFTATAAHCRQFGQTLQRNGVALPPEEYGTLPDDIAVDEDWLLLEVPAPVAPPIASVYVDSSSQFPIHGPWRSWMSGQSRAMKGITSGYNYGVDLGVACGWGASDYERAGGDSGGPVVYPYGTPRAVGVHHGVECNGTVVYTRIYNVELGNVAAPEYAVVAVP